MKVPAIVLLSVVLATKAMPSALIQTPMAENSVEEEQIDPEAAENMIVVACLEAVAEAAVLEAMGKMAHAQAENMQNHATAAEKAKGTGRSTESKDRKSTDIENRWSFFEGVRKAWYNIFTHG